MEVSRRRFSKRLAALTAMTFGGTQLLAGCLGQDSGSDASGSSSASTAQPAAQQAPAPTQSLAPAETAAPSTGSGPTQTAQNAAPIWQPSPSITFEEGVPAVVSVRQFVRDPNNDPLIIVLNSGQLLPGITWNPTNATLAYDGRPLGAKPNAPVVLTGVTFSADDQKP